ncbi:suppressor of tub2 mutation [Coelomomyces lativittatus]|nr:suppressor of tub2 mutation [Coelomomyces lativittatus]
MTALVTMEEILLSFAPILDPMSDILLVALLKSLSSTKKMIHVAASQTILMLLQKCYLKSRIIEKIVSCVDDKNVQIRIYAIQFIQCIVEIDPHKCSDVILNALKKGITNAHPQVRESSRQCYYALVHMNKWKSEIFLNMLDIATRKVLSKGDKPPTFQSVLTSPPNLIGSSTSQATTAIASTTPPPPSNTSKLLVSNLPNGSHDTMSMSDSLTLMHRKNDKMKSPIKDREGSPKKGVHGSMSHTASFSTSHTKLLSSMDPPSPTPFFISAVDTFVLDPVDLPSYLTLYQCSRRPMVSKMDMDVFVQAFHQPSIQVMAMACFVYSVQLHGFPSSFLPSFPSIWFKYLDEPGEVGFWAHEGLLEVTQRHPILMNDLILHQPFIPVHFGVLHGIQEEAWNVLGQSIGEGCTHRDIHQRYRATQCLAELLNSHPHWITSWIDKGCILDQHVEKAQRWIDWGKKKAMVEFT